jgi:hypothetical protein
VSIYLFWCPLLLGSCLTLEVRGSTVHRQYSVDTKKNFRRFRKSSDNLCPLLLKCCLRLCFRYHSRHFNFWLNTVEYQPDVVALLAKQRCTRSHGWNTLLDSRVTKYITFRLFWPKMSSTHIRLRHRHSITDWNTSEILIQTHSHQMALNVRQSASQNSIGPVSYFRKHGDFCTPTPSHHPRDDHADDLVMLNSLCLYWYYRSVLLCT